MADIDRFKFPIGKFEKPDKITKALLDKAIAEIRRFPDDLKALVENMSDAQLDMPYRDGGWTARQVVHHCGDSHMNAFIRFKLALTEKNPTIKAYNEAEWAKLPDSSLPLSFSIDILKGLHYKWVHLLEGMSTSDFGKTYFHPESKSKVSLEEATLMYEWHGKHHLAHIKIVSSR